MVSAFPPRYTQAMVSGQSLSGLAVALAGILVSLAGPDNDSCVRAQGHQYQAAFTSGFAIPGAHTVKQQMAGGQYYGRALTYAALEEEYFLGDAHRWLDDSMLTVAETVGSGSDLFEQVEAPAFQSVSSSTLSSTMATVAAPMHGKPMSDDEPNSVEVETLIRYSIAITVLLACMVTFVVLERLPLTLFYVTHQQHAVAAAEEEGSGGSSNIVRIEDQDSGRGRTVSGERGGLCRYDGCKADSWKSCSSANFSNNGDSSPSAALLIAVSDGLAASSPTLRHHIEGQRQHPLQQPFLPTFPSASEDDLSRQYLLSHSEHDYNNTDMVSAIGEEYVKEGMQREERNTSDASILERGSSRALRENGGLSSLVTPGIATTTAREAESRVLLWKMSRRWVQQTTDTYGSISRYAFCVFFCFTVSISVYPATTSEIVSTRGCTPGRARFFGEDTFMLFSFVSYNASDFLGRLAAGYAGLSFSLFGMFSAERWLLPAAVCRIVFIPLLLACRTMGSSSSPSSPSEGPLFMRNGEELWVPLRADHLIANTLGRSDVYPLVLVPLLGFTNGFLVCLGMMGGSQKSSKAGTAMVLSLSAGLFAGSLASFLVLLLTDG